ncbi:RsmB/NOP family class I SAM-dependent RNA methyltransferase [Lapillicoccus jejuensis]|uniref:16S rRNA (Cytosine967-C5)-methyltransferase n=1 Tax=Lapillicoccus jejuensis TaxID=402171 RepID=A0A542E6F1_9MICO|nr:transcription antitermination factor NusB [Lapillicoccus jejuensis]TQJ10912.1 16S rRNA (cytosine967-C5)-methyltransferase [Lapillicoccus jejuensis]
MPDDRRPRRPGRTPQRSLQRPAERTRRADPARLAAYTVLRAVADGAYANLELPTVLRERGIGGRDAAFATELAYGTTRMHGLYDAVVEAAAARPVADIDPPVLDTLRLGAHQLLGMRVPEHAAVAETVGLARQVNGAGAAGFVNAVLRRVSEADRETWVARVAPESLDPTQRRAVATSHPAWVVKALRAALLGHGAATADDVDEQLDALLAGDNTPALVSLVARPGLVDPAQLLEVLGDAGRPGDLARTAVTLLEGDPGRLAAVREGRAAVQDEGSQLLALALAAAPVDGDRGDGDRADGDRTDERWLDLCAGPGGKAGLLAALALERGADLVANEVAPHRADLVRATLAPATHRARAAGRAGQVSVRVGDGRDVGRDEPASYDRVLVDAPCTGLGALRRRPEARWRRQPSDVPALASLQRELLASAIDATRPGGVVAYATCSPHLGETRFVVDDVTRRRDDVELLDARPLLTDRDGRALDGTGDGPTAQLWPHRHGTDGMFLALLRRTGA